ncbi:uncharacterized protein K452DRAFT_272724 [Aplosporella prunicola CBS 121167]|uniref:MARVEL domain-containing protein n=1 Tax=Aplosporella prunicola CBS 121167 TaxID=1176127 RepID=A0A6A6BA69_9PEZI|nr:uncharacterized protein K452DRAFT_272724 [Aplosporella prunicola CBS 121167]KAF2140970.1 hypothetical protein K452DRAFT_272724 [Aplosporella prunicola CBS 121167]
MALSGFLFICWRILEILTLIPTLGMLAWFVKGYVSLNTLTPDFILLLFITSVLAAAWAIATLVGYLRVRHSALFVAIVDLAFVGCFIGGVYLLRFVSDANCSSNAPGDWYYKLGMVGYYGRSSNTDWSMHPHKTCSMLKACFAFGIMNCIFFFTTFLLALLVHRHHLTDVVHVKRSSTHYSRHSHRSRSRDYPPSPRRSHHSSRRAYV